MRLISALLIALGCAAAADSPFVGRWKIDEAQSKPDPAGPGITARIVEFSIENGVLTAKAWGSDGSARPNIVKYDGEEQAAAVKSVNPLGYTTMVSNSHGSMVSTLFKKDGKVVGSRADTLSRDGRTMTITLSGTTVDGRKLHSTLVYHKQ